MGPRYDHKLTPNRRIKSRSDFLRIQTHGSKQRTRHLLLSINRLTEAAGSDKFAADRAPSDRSGSKGAPDSRFGVTVTTKVHKRAVMRNRLKRRLREIFRRLRGRFQFPIEFVAIALAGSTELEYKELEGEIVFGLIKAGVLRPNRRAAPGGARR